jgi:hypothetical protein
MIWNGVTIIFWLAPNGMRTQIRSISHSKRAVKWTQGQASVVPLVSTPVRFRPWVHIDHGISRVLCLSYNTLLTICLQLIDFNKVTHWHVGTSDAMVLAVL